MYRKTKYVFIHEIDSIKIRYLFRLIFLYSFFLYQGILYNLVEILSDDTRQSEINITSNDGQISKWLEQTFSSKQQRPTTAAARFESIKAIIQASSFVNALQRQIRQNAKERLSAMLDLPVDIHKLNSWSFNTMEYEEPIHFSLLLIFDAHDLISRYHIDIDALKNLSRAITEGYQSESKPIKILLFRYLLLLFFSFLLEFKTPYHNEFHGADVLQTTHCILLKSNLMNVFTQIEIAALVRQK